MNHIVYLSSDDEDDKKVYHSNLLETPDEKPKNDLSNDDDCVVLDGDPYKTTAQETTVDTCETDDVLVVGQKGEIACRDYPHSRHACAKFPFHSTPHENFCDMCHCYVCDTRAPCAHWFKGLIYIDHCHANDKDQLWKNTRETIRTGKVIPRPVLKTPAPIAQWHRPLTSSSAPGIRACSTSVSVATHPNTYVTHGYSAEQPRTFPQNPVLQPSGGQLYSYNPIPKVVPSYPYRWNSTPGGGVTRSQNSIHNYSQGSPYTCYAPPASSQANAHRIIPDYSSTIPAAGQYRPTMYSGNVQTSAGIPSQTPNPIMYSGSVQTSSGIPSQTPHTWVNQQQQQHSGKSDDNLLWALEDWLMDPATLSGQNTTTTPQFDYEYFDE